MKLILIGLLVASTSFSVFAKTKLDCYEEYQAPIEKLDTEILNTYEELFSREEVILDQIFSPGSYYRGPHVPYVRQKQADLLNTRAILINAINSSRRSSEELSRELTKCLKSAKK